MCMKIICWNLMPHNLWVLSTTVQHGIIRVIFDSPFMVILIDLPQIAWEKKLSRKILQNQFQFDR